MEALKNFLVLTRSVVGDEPDEVVLLCPLVESGGKYISGSHFPPADVGFAARSRRVNTLKKCSQLSRRPELRDGFQFL